jgi:hypothetical protein
MRALIALPFLAVLSFASAAAADPPSNMVMKVAPAGEKPAQADAAVMCVHKYQMQAAQLGQLGAMLKLTDAQKPVFAAWRKARLDMFEGVPCPEPSMGFDVSGPKRIENQIAIMSAMLDGLHKELPATQALYKALTPEQRAVFDGPIKMSTAPPPVNDKPQAAH